MNANDKIMDKLEKLLRLAGSSNENEAYVAAQKAQELFVKYNISRNDVDRLHHDTRRVVQKSTGISCTAMTDPWVINLACVIADNHKCKAFRYQAPRARLMTIGFIGFEEDFEFCFRIFKYAYNCVTERCKELRARYKSAYTAGQLREAANAYGAGFVSGLRAVYRKQQEEHQEWGLVLVTPTEVNDIFQKMSNPKAFGKVNLSEHGAEYNRGYRDGLNFDPSSKLAG